MIVHVRQNSRERRHVALIPHRRAAPHLDYAQQTAGQATHSQRGASAAKLMTQLAHRHDQVLEQGGRDLARSRVLQGIAADSFHRPLQCGNPRLFGQ